MLEIETLVLGPVETNVYLVGDIGTNQCVVVDPAWDGELIAQTAMRRGWTIQQIWLTHAHFDHLGGVGNLVKTQKPAPPIGLHPADLPLWEKKGGADWFGFHIDPGPKPEIPLEDQALLAVGSSTFQVRHTPGHTPGHVVFYAAEEKLVFCGDFNFCRRDWANRFTWWRFPTAHGQHHDPNSNAAR